MLNTKTGRYRGGWNRDSRLLLKAIDGVLDELHNYLPATLRQVYYRLVANGTLANNQNQYEKLSRTLARARIDGLVSWNCIEDRARTMLYHRSWSDSDSFMRFELAYVFQGYRRNLLQSQPMALELWIEKDALSRLAEDVADRYCIPVVVARGFSSISYLHECSKRVRQNTRQGKKTRLLYFGDLDPSGWEMLPAMMTTLEQEMECAGMVEGVRCALTPDQALAQRLPYSVDAIKDKDKRTPKYRRMLQEAGLDDSMAVELDALEPAVLQDIIRQAIEENLDLPTFERERAVEKQEIRHIEERRTALMGLLAGATGGNEV